MKLIKDWIGTKRYIDFLLHPLSIVLLLTFIIYFPGLYGGYISDDYPNIVSNRKLVINEITIDELTEAATSSQSGIFKRPISMISFAANLYIGGDNPFYFKLINLLIHIINGVLIYIYLRIILGFMEKEESINNQNIFSGNCSLIVTSIWLLHPINLSSVLYIVQRMNLLASLFTLIGLIIFAKWRKHLLIKNNKNYYPLLMILLSAITAILCKENGAIIFLYMVLMEFIIFSYRVENKQQVKLLNYFYIITFALPLFLITIFVTINPELLNEGYISRDFNLIERLMTEARVIWMYIYMIILPKINLFSLFHDDINISKTLFDPPSTLLSISGILLLIGIAFAKRHKIPSLSFGILFFFAGHSLESTLYPLEIAYEHRNYLPSIGILMALVVVLYGKYRILQNKQLIKIFAVLFIIVLAGITNLRARQWGDPQEYMFYELKHKPNSARVNYEIGRHYAILLDRNDIDNKDELYEKASHYLNRSISLKHNSIEAMVAILIMDSSNSRDVDGNLVGILLNKIKTEPVSSTGLASIISLLNCKKTSECKLNDYLINNIIKNIGMNKRIFGREKSVLYTNIAKYYMAANDVINANKAIAIAVAEDVNNREAIIIKNTISDIYSK